MPLASESLRRCRQLEIRDDRVSSARLLSDRGHLVIEHAQVRYQLRRTSSGKLILTREPGLESS